ncbi:hypothetical protein [Chryseolinea lacunae]|uniref:Uncharacterized protein n=1 Tax=Chryseolinea lacunae TaxID=2801331 RepID=A0ABS1KUC7_9BACT|nr:hypothetical protein [Chryseolinea lacunae]MBL0743088.1 hypothetical protein [Chryseolinea lacunae]
MKNVSWFKEEVEPYLQSFEVNYRFFEDGDFGDLNQVSFDSNEKGGEVDFWSSGWLSVFLYDYLTSTIILHVMLKPDEEEEKEKVLMQLKELLKQK